MGFSRWQYWSGLPFPSPGDLPDLGIKCLLCLKREYEFLSTKLKNGIHELHTLSSKQIGFITRKKVRKSQHRHKRGRKSPKRWGLRQFYVFTSINLYNFGCLLFLNHVVSNQFKGQDPSLNLRLLLTLKLSCHLFMSPDYSTLDQTYGFKINDHQSFFPQAYGTEVNYCPFLDLSAYNSSDQRHIPEIWDHRAGCLLKTRLRSQSSILTA